MINLLVAVIIAAIVYVVAAIFLPSPIPLLLALLALVIGFGGAYRGRV